MIEVTVTDTPLDERKGVGKESGKPYHMRTQFAYAHVISNDGVLCDFPEKFAIDLDDGQVPYPRGKYRLVPSMIKVMSDKFSKPLLVLGRAKLVPVVSK